MTLKKKLKVGDEIEAKCTKCRTVKAHTIIALIEGEPKKVTCVACGSEHKFYPPQPAAAAPKKKAAVKAAPKPSDEPKERHATPTEWMNAVHGVADDKFKPYILNGLYQETDCLLHPHFGKGRVMTILGPGKMEVLFESGMRRLIYNRKNP